MSTELGQALERVARRFRRLRLWAALAVCWLAWAAAGVAVYALSVNAGVTPGWRSVAVLAALAAATAVLCAALAARSARDPRWVARRIEVKHPDLGTGLLAAMEQDSTRRLGFLQTAVIQEALAHAARSDWDATVSPRALRGLKVAHAVAVALFLVSLAAVAGRVPWTAAGTTPQDLAAVAAADVQVEPGNTELERGSTLLVVARFPGVVPADASLIVTGKAPAARVKMARSLDDPTFAARVESVDADLTYRVAFGPGESETFSVRVFDYPELRRADAKLDFPAYTSLPSKTVEDVRHVTAVEGTDVTITARLNKEVVSAKLVDEAGKEVILSPRAGATNAYTATVKATDPRRFKVALVDKDGRTNKRTADLVLNVTRNRPAVVTTTQPSHDVRVSPVEELTLRAKLEDDFGVVRRGVTFSAAGKEAKDVEFTGPVASRRKIEADHLLDFEAMKAAPDELVTYFFWAEDVGPDGRPRRTSGDMFFAEVRHFEEIFRQGEQPPGGSAQDEQEQGESNAQQAEKLAELQKQIINATWTLIRREAKTKPTDALAADARTLKESQHAALEQAAAAKEKLKDETSIASLDQAARSMNDAEKKLAEAADTNTTTSLRPALAAEQAAYQALLKLRAREFEVIRNNSRQRPSGGQAGGSPSQRQLNQLELKNDENRYEQQTRASKQPLTKKEQEQREDRQVSNRLRELAQRQNDLNERVKELQSALEAAKTETAREELRRQLKRLRDQQEQILRDTDELQERTEREENRDRLADARQQIEQSRENLRQAAQALEDGKLPQAVTEGARAGRQLDELREQIRKNASNRFGEEMTELRDQAKGLDDAQKRLSDQIEAGDKAARKSLRDGDRDAARKGLEAQGEKLDKLLDRMRDTVQDAEETEPLLAKSLYDTTRKAEEQKIPDALKIAEQLTAAGVTDEAADASRRAGRGLTQLREGVERAAESVLGDETAGLKRARAELDDLGEQVDREVARAEGRDPSAASRPGEAAKSAGTAREKGQRKPQGQGKAQPGQAEPGGDQPPQPGEDGPPGQEPGEDPAKGQAQEGQGKGQAQGKGQGQAQAKGQPGGGGGQPKGLRGGPGGQERQAGSPQGGGGGGLDRVMDGLTPGPGGPITGDGYREWSDRMRDVEELLNDPGLRGEAARIRDRVRGAAREEFKRHSKPPDPRKLQEMVAEPIRELRQRVADEVRRRESPDSLVPIDRDPVPPKFTEGVKRYYERLGSGQ